MHPELADLGGITLYSYGFMIAVGAILGVSYMAMQGRREAGLTFDQTNSLFLLIFVAAFVGGKVFLFFEDPAFYSSHPGKLLTGRGFVFYGSFLFAVPVMIWFFRKNRLDKWVMLDVMAVTTCLVHASGRVGCFLAGCCYGTPTTAFTGVSFRHPESHAKPAGVPLHPTQLYEAVYILIVMAVLLWLRPMRRFKGQLFLIYLLAYSAGRFVIEFYRGDLARGYVVKGYVSNSQFVSLLIFFAVLYFYVRRSQLATPGAIAPRKNK